ncbi:protein DETOXIFICATION 24 [Fagus crenata]
MDNLVLEERLLGSEAEEQPNLKRRIWVESKLIWRIASPSMLSRVTSFGMIVVTQVFLGHVAELELAAFALVQSVVLRFVNGILCRSSLYSLIPTFLRIEGSGTSSFAFTNGKNSTEIINHESLVREAQLAKLNNQPGENS